jgi:hypothetical protein
LKRAGTDMARMKLLQAALKRHPDILAGNIRSHLKTSGADWQGKMLNRFRGNPMRTRTGALKRSMRHKVTGSKLRNIKLRAVSTSRYAAVHEYGTVGKGGSLPDIRPKRAKHLTIPLPDNLTPAGVARYPSARKLIARDPTAFFHTSSSGVTTIGIKKGGSLKFLWVLKKKVSIPARLGFFLTWHQLRDRRRSTFANAVRYALSGVAR